MAFELSKLLRENIRNLVPYSSARSEFSGEGRIFLDANESPYAWGEGGASWNRYPDPLQKKLREKIAKYRQVEPSCVFTANGSDEAIDLLIRAVCRPGTDRILTFKPSYGMYDVAAHVNDAAADEVPLDENFNLNVSSLLSAVTPQTRIIFLCSPNNPTGTIVEKADVEKILRAFDGLVVLDEAYVDFSTRGSFTGILPGHPNLVILQTLSKAWGAAGVRVGMLFGSKELVSILDKMKSPYNMSDVNQAAALKTLSHWRRKEQNVRITVRERERLEKELPETGMVENVFPSEANFLLVRLSDDAGRIYGELLKQGIIVRNRSSEYGCGNCVRITVGTPEENDKLLAALRDLKAGNAVCVPVEAPRTSEVSRSTKETSVYVRLDLDGEGKASICSKLSFFNHMLELFAFHSGFDLSLDLEGDIEVDSHHSIEDAALCLGEAFRKAIGNKEGIERYGYVLPMDEALASAALDLSGRPELVLEGIVPSSVPSQDFRHFFKSFSDAAQCTLHIQVKGENDHHIIEAAFKAFGRALGAAARRDLRHKILPSTKGML